MDSFPPDPPILFLDIDGVLNTCGRGSQGLHEDKVELLADIISQTGCELVISSSWRNHEEPKRRIQQMASFHGFRIAGWTPNLENEFNQWKPPSRGEEIQAWLDKNPTPRFAILDDNRELGSLQPFAVFTDSNIGLTPEIAEEVIKRLLHC